MKSFLNILMATGVIMLLFGGCETEVNSPISDSGEAPGTVSDVQVLPTPGGANIVYKLPDNKNLLYVEAEINTPEGRSFTAKSSAYTDTIKILGLATTNPQEVLLYSVSTGGKKSEPLSVSVTPLTPPYVSVASTLSLEDGLGGVSVRYTNESRNDLAFYLLRLVDGKYVPADTYYSNAKDGRILFWGYPAETQKFAVYLVDRWNHYSDTVYADITPIPEILIDKAKFKAIRLAYDSEYSTDQFMKPENLWNGKWSDDYKNPYTAGDVDWRHATFVEDLSADMPASVTIDLGEITNISRIRFNHYWTYSGDMPRKYEVYVLEDYAENSVPYDWGEWSNWTLVATIENNKPSAIGGTADDDAKAWEAGDVATMTPPTDAVRYIRIKSVESWNGKRNMDFAEMTVYGRPVQ